MHYGAQGVVFSVTEQAEQEKSHSLGLIWGVCAYWQKIEIYDKICVLTFLSASHIHLKTFPSVLGGRARPSGDTR